VQTELLLQSQENDVYAAIHEAGLNAADFSWSDTATTPMLSHKPSGAYFRFGRAYIDLGTQFTSEYSPASDRRSDSRWSSSWKEQLVEFRSWSSAPSGSGKRQTFGAS
jgi:hypothetical protein